MCEICETCEILNLVHLAQGLPGAAHDVIVHGPEGWAGDKDGHQPVEAVEAFGRQGHGHSVRGQNLRRGEQRDVGKVGQQVDGRDDTNRDANTFQNVFF